MGPVTLTLLNGVVRAVAAEHRACRITIEGPEAAVLAVALALAGELRAGRAALPAWRPRRFRSCAAAPPPPAP